MTNRKKIANEVGLRRRNVGDIGKSESVSSRSVKSATSGRSVRSFVNVMSETIDRSGKSVTKTREVAPKDMRASENEESKSKQAKRNKMIRTRNLVSKSKPKTTSSTSSVWQSVEASSTLAICSHSHR